MGRFRRALVLTGLALIVVGATASSAAAQLNVYVGYADNLRANPVAFPTPWQGAPSTTFIGSGSPWDAGSVRFVNNDSAPVSVGHVTVDLHHGAGGASGPTFDLWGNVTVPANGQVILTQTTQYNFDTSDFPFEPCGTTAPASDPRIPTVSFTVGGSTQTLSDSGHVLDTGGFDRICRGNESTQWTLIGGNPCPSASLTLAPPTQTDAVGTPATVTATLTNSGGPTCGQPLQGAVVNFRVNAGPNTGRTGSAVTDVNGHASFTYTSTVTGTDTVGASVTNPAGTIGSNPVTVHWGTLVRAGTFSCRGTAANLLGAALVVANPPDSPCANANKSLLPLTLGGTGLGVLNASTSVHGGKLPAAGDNGTAKASAVSLLTSLIPGHTIKAGVVTSQATVGCVSNPGGGLSTVMTSSSNVASLTIDGKSYVVGNGPLTISVGTLATVYVNRTIVTANSRTQRAIEIDLNGKPIVIAAQAEVDSSGNPCGTTII